MESKPLGLPPGSIRAILALSLTAATLTMAGIGIDVSQGQWTVFAGAVAFYFGQKVQT